MGDLEDRILKLVFIGDSNVGKSSLIRNFIDDAPPDLNSTNTVGVDFKICTIDLKKETIKLNIWDTAGQERFNCMSTSYYRGSHGFFLVYDITNENSFRNLSRWMDNIDRHGDPNVCKFLIGNKCDLEKQRAVEYSLAQEYAEQRGIGFLETSAVTSERVSYAFYSLADEIATLQRGGLEHEDPTSFHLGGSRAVTEDSKSGWCCS